MRQVTTLRCGSNSGIFLIQKLAIMAAVFGLGEEDNFEVELSRQELGEGAAYFSLGHCIYTKFPDFVADLTKP
ncbi:MAG TPA: hypothetical protein VGO04_31250 [Ensifer sp.]|uniref:hypothetical protein n=1 Tax=Ensifer sp. TaxID=1872086 RepID=UPI002E10A9FC|nr:hypothetical protein [Ensifer sp.]